MATIRQMQANQQNSQKSTGPKTPEGKAVSSRNRLSHGFASSATIMPGENPQEFIALLDDFTAEYQPATVTEQILIEKMATHQWLTLRAFRLQGEAFARQSISGENGLPEDLSLLIRYHVSAERAFHKAHNDLVKTQKERKKSEIGFEPQQAAQPPEPPAPEPKQSPDPLADNTCEYKIVPEFTYLTPQKAAKAAVFTQAA